MRGSDKSYGFRVISSLRCGLYLFFTRDTGTDRKRFHAF
jgi:hypothetical protein